MNQRGPAKGVAQQAEDALLRPPDQACAKLWTHRLERGQTVGVANRARAHHEQQQRQQQRRARRRGEARARHRKARMRRLRGWREKESVCATDGVER